MKRFLITIAVLALLASCGGEKEGGETASNDSADQTATTNQRPPSKPAIPDAGDSGFDDIASGRIRPAFDIQGIETTKAVAPGEMFDIFVVGEYNDAFAMSGAEYKLTMPDGITVLGASFTDSIIVTLGKPETDFLMAFHCLPGPGDWLVKYLCRAEESFQGGTIETHPGDNLAFIGFVMCDQLKTEIRAQGGTAEITRK